MARNAIARIADRPSEFDVSAAVDIARHHYEV
jgi:hypothetical protein